MKREIMITVISVFAEIGAWSMVYMICLLITDWDFLVCITLATIISSAAGLLAWQVLDENLRGKKKSPRAATRKAQTNE